MTAVTVCWRTVKKGTLLLHGQTRLDRGQHPRVMYASYDAKDRQSGRKAAGRAVKPAPRHKLGRTLRLRTARRAEKRLECPYGTTSFVLALALPKYRVSTSANICVLFTSISLPLGNHILGSAPAKSSIVSTWPSKKPTLKRKWPPLAPLTLPP